MSKSNSGKNNPIIDKRLSASKRKQQLEEANVVE